MRRAARAALMTTDLTDIYTRLAPLYDAWTRLTESKSLGVLLERAAIQNGEAVLEVAVGTGIVFREILRRNPLGRNVGIDLTEEMVRRARRRAARTGVPFELAVGDARRLQLADASFDVVVSSNMFGLVAGPDIAAILGEMHRVLRPGGRLVIATMRRPRTAASAWIYRIGAERLGGWRDVEIEPAVVAAGFQDPSRRVVTQLGIPTEVLAARKPG